MAKNTGSQVLSRLRNLAGADGRNYKKHLTNMLKESFYNDFQKETIKIILYLKALNYM